MKIYSIKVDSNKFQWIMPQITSDLLLDYVTFDCNSKLDFWRDVEWYSFNPKNNLGNFFSIGNSGAFAFDQAVYDSDLFPLFEIAGEILPINFGDKKLYIINILECVNSLDENASKWDVYSDGSRGGILKYNFFTDRISESTLFKIPQTCKGEIFTYADVKDENDEFIRLYQKLGFSGLVFDQVF